MFYRSIFIIRVVISISFLAISYSLRAQNQLNLGFEQLGIEDGLSQVTARCILQDDQGYIWIGTQDGLNRFDGYSFKVYRHDPEDSSSISSSFINCMIQTSNGRLMTGTRRGLNIYNARLESFAAYQHQPGQTNSLSHNNVTALLEDSKKRAWVGTKNGLNLIDSTKAAIKQFHNLPLTSGGISDSRITSLFEDQIGNIWIGTENGLNLYEESTRTFRCFYHNASDESSISSNHITKIFQDRDGQIWIGTVDGLNQFEVDGISRRYVHDPNDDNSISGNAILSIFQGSNENLWFGTSADGLNLYDHSNNTFARYQHDADDPSSISNNSIWSITEDRSGNLWVGVSNRGVNFHDPRTQSFEHIRYQPNNNISLLDNAVRSILIDSEEQLWMGSFTGLTMIDRSRNQIRYYQHSVDDPNSLSANYVISLLQDHKGQIWIGTSQGLNVYVPENDQIVHYLGNDEGSLDDLVIGTIMQDHTRSIWVGTDKNGVYRIDAEKGTLKNFVLKEANGDNFPEITVLFQDSRQDIWAGTDAGLCFFNPNSQSFEEVRLKNDAQGAISSGSIMCLTEDLKGRIWVGTDNGFNLFDPNLNAFKSYHTKDGLSNEVVYGALVDDDGLLWFSTNKGINRFDPESETFTTYDKHDGLQGDEFNNRAYHKDDKGYLYFGGVNGLSIFHPDSIGQNTFLPPVVLTDFLLFNQSVEVSDTTVLKEAIDYIQEIVLEYDQDMFAFEFSALNYKQSAKNQFAYKLEPFNEDWIYTSSDDRKAVFTRTPPGDYLFSVKASNDDGLWNEEAKTIKIKILPPWWRTWWAISLYVILSLMVALLVIRFQWKRIQLRNRLKLEQQGAEQLKALDQLKTQFFSNITHEFRTPLTLIIGPSEQILQQNQLDESFTRTQVEMILRNSRKFLLLINQLLDLSKLESKQMTLDLYRGDLNEFVKNIVEQFEIAAQQKKIRLGFKSNLPVNDLLFDRDKLDKALFNLLSNGLKFTPSDGHIQVNIGIKEDTGEKIAHVLITVEDDGVGISSDQLTRIFDRFYQVDDSSKKEHQGTGIGLALTKELIEAHGGKIEVASQLEKGTVFKIFLPLEKATGISEQGNADQTPTSSLSYSMLEKLNVSEDPSTVDDTSDQPIVLIIEDNEDLRAFIKSVIVENYQTITAKNGVEGIELGLKHIPDLIISDVMMPEKDGYEVTHALKNNPLTSHVPIILLTAKSTLKSRVAGFEEGADAYLTKPFSVEELMLVANRQIETRRTLQAMFANSPQENADKSTYRKMDQELLDRLHDFIESNLNNEQLTVDELAKEASMSHSQLYRKIKALTNWSIASFIRNYRLDRAMDLLKTGEHNVSEVADMTGFGDRRYFHKTFVDKFDYPPSQVLKEKG